MIVPGTGIHLNNMLGEYDLNPAGGAARPGARLTSMMAPSIVLRRGRPRLVVGSAGSVRLRGAIMQAVVNVVDHGLRRRGGDRRAAGPPRGAARPLRGRRRPGRARRARGARLRRRPLAPAEPLLRRRRRRRGRRGRRRSPRPATRAAAGTGSWSWDEPTSLVATGPSPGDAAALVALAEAVGLGAGGLADLATSRWRSVADERRYLRRVRRHPDAAVFVAERTTAIVGRLSVARDPHPASRHVADLGLMVAASAPAPGRRARRCSSRPSSGRATSGVRKLELHVFPHNEPAIALYERFGFVREGYRKRALPPRHASYVDAILMAYERLDRPTRVRLVARDLAVPRGALAHLALARERLDAPARAGRRAGRAGRARSGARAAPA